MLSFSTDKKLTREAGFTRYTVVILAVFAVGAIALLFTLGGGGTVDPIRTDGPTPNEADPASDEARELSDESVTFDVYFSDESAVVAGDCRAVTAVERSVPETRGVARAALLKLLAGPREAEVAAGLTTTIPSEVELLGITVSEDGVVQADFSAQLDMVAGSCRVIAIREQIEETLLQFPTVERVVISIEGRTEGILQP